MPILTGIWYNSSMFSCFAGVGGILSHLPPASLHASNKSKFAHVYIYIPCLPSSTLKSITSDRPLTLRLNRPTSQLDHAPSCTPHILWPSGNRTALMRPPPYAYHSNLMLCPSTTTTCAKSSAWHRPTRGAAWRLHGELHGCSSALCMHGENTSRPASCVLLLSL